MRHRVPLVAALAVLAAGSCSNAGYTGFVTSDLDAYCAVATRADLVSWVGDVVTLCEQGEIDDHGGTCTAGRVLEGGEIQPIDLADALELQLALPASGGRLVVLLADQRLVLVSASGQIEREIDRWASEPAVSPDGERVAWIGLPEGFDIAEAYLGTPKVVAVQSLAEATRTVLVEDPMASAPRPIPGSAEVLYVSGNEDGVAGFFIAGPTRGATQITNIGRVEDNEEIDPVSGASGYFAANGSFFYSVTGLESVDEVIDDPDAELPPEDEIENGELVDDAELDVGHLFRLVLVDDVASVEELGEGSWPTLTSEGNLFAALPSGSSPCATTYTLEGAP